MRIFSSPLLVSRIGAFLASAIRFPLVFNEKAVLFIEGMALWAMSFGLLRRGNVVSSSPIQTHRFLAFNALASRHSVTRSYNSGIALAELVAVFAVSLFPLALSSFATNDIFSVRDRLQVSRIATQGDPALMVQLKTFRYGADKKLITDNVREFQFSERTDLSISLIVSISCPNPAARIRLRGNAIQEAVKKRYSSISHVTPFSRIATAALMLQASARPFFTLPQFNSISVSFDFDNPNVS